MKKYEITYKYNEKDYTVTETPTKGFEAQFAQKVLNRIESLVDAGAIITKIVNYNEKKQSDRA